jgi:hypothetical protein
VEARINGSCKMTGIARMYSRGGIVPKRTSIDERLDAPKADGVKNNGLVGRKPGLLFVHCSVGQVMGKIEYEPAPVSGADGSVFVQFPQQENLVPDN